MFIQFEPLHIFVLGMDPSRYIAARISMLKMGLILRMIVYEFMICTVIMTYGRFTKILIWARSFKVYNHGVTV